MPAVTTIADLSAEVLCLVIENLPLSSHFAFACTCRELAAASQYVLRRHQNAHRQFGVASDLDPSTVPLLLQSAFGTDPFPAWHVRSFEVWRDRTTWDEWTTYSLLVPPISDWGNNVSELDVVSFQSLLGKVGEYLDWFKEHAVQDINKENALAQVETGHDGLLKALLFAKCPRLQDLKFVTRAADNDSGSTLWWLKSFISVSKGIRPDPERSQCFQSHDSSHREEAIEENEEAEETWERFEKLMQQDYTSETESDLDREWETAYANWMEEQALQEMESMETCENEVCERKISPGCAQDSKTGSMDDILSSTKITDLNQCPDGFVNLRYVAVGIVSDTWMDDNRWPCSVWLIAHLLRLPNLDSLYFNGLRCNGEGNCDGNIETSGHDDGQMSVWDHDSFPVHSSSLKHLFVEGLGFELDGGASMRLFNAPRKLLTAAFRNSGPDSDDLHRASRIVRDLADAQGSSLQSLMWYGFGTESISSDECSVAEIKEFNRLLALQQTSFNVYDLAKGAERSTWGHVPEGFEGHDAYYVKYAAEAFPKTLEFLVLWGDAGSGACGDEEGETVLLEHAIIRMIEDGRYKSLKAIFLEEVERTTDCRKGVVSFERVVAVGKAKGVEVYTKTNRPLQQSMSFPEPVEKWDLRTGKYPDGRPNDWVFNNYTGRREPPSCAAEETG